MIKFNTFYAPQQTMQNGVFGEHYNGYYNYGLGDALYFENRKPVSIRIDSTVNVQPELSATTNGDNFTVRWQFLFFAETAGQYSFTLNSDDTGYMFIGDAAIESAPILSRGVVSNQTPSSIVVTLKVGYHPFLIYYGNSGGGRYVSFDYTPPGGGYQTVPSNKLFLPPEAYSNGLKADYYNGCYNANAPNFFDNVSLYSRIDNKVEFSNNFPLISSVLGTDNFSVRWVGYVKIDVAGSYTFTTFSDDIAHFFIGDAALSISPTQDLSTGTYSNNGNGQIVVTLDVGYTPILLYFGEASGAEVMNLSYSGPNISAMIIPADKLFYRSYKHQVQNHTNPPITDSLVIDLDPRYGVEYIPGSKGMISWKNKINDAKLTVNGNTVFVPNDAAFGNLPTVRNVTGNGFQPYVLDGKPNAFTLIMVAQREPTSDSMLWSNGPDSGGIDLFSAAGRLGLNAWGGESYGPTPPELSNANIFTTTINDVDSTSNSYRLHINGSYADPSTYMGPVPGNRSISSSFRFGSAASNGYVWFGSFARILLYNRVLASDELNKVHNYLSTIYKKKLDNEIASDPYFKLTLDNNQGGATQNGRWATTYGWSFQNGLAVANNGQYLWEDLVVIAGAEYEIEVVIDEFISGNLIITSTSTPYIPLYTSGTHRYRYTQNGSVQRMHLYGTSNFCGVVSKFSVTQIGNPPAAIDVDVTNFTTAASITDETQKLAVKNLVAALKQHNLWGKMKTIYPFIGGSEISHVLNLKDPRFFDTSFRLYFPNGATHDANGVHFNANDSQYARTYYIPSQHTAQGSGGTIIYYVKSPHSGGSADPVDIGSYTSPNDLFFIRTVTSDLRYGGVSNNYIQSPIKFEGGYISAAGGNFNMIPYTYFNQNKQVANVVSNVNTNINLEQFIGCINFPAQSGAYGFTTANARFAAFGEQLTIAENKLFCDAVEAYQLTLGRAVAQNPLALYTAASFPTNSTSILDWKNEGTMGTLYNLKSQNIPAVYNATGCNGKPCVSLSGQMYFSTVNNFFIRGSQAKTYIIVVRSNGIGFKGVIHQGIDGFKIFGEFTFGRFLIANKSNGYSATGANGNQWLILTVRSDDTYSKAAVKNNTPGIYNFTNAEADTAYAPMLVGYDVSQDTGTIDIAEIQIYNSYLNEDDLNIKITILSGKYAI